MMASKKILHLVRCYAQRKCPWGAIFRIITTELMYAEIIVKIARLQDEAFHLSIDN
jgi:hypothetical protein